MLSMFVVVPFLWKINKNLKKSTFVLYPWLLFFLSFFSPHPSLEIVHKHAYLFTINKNHHTDWKTYQMFIQLCGAASYSAPFPVWGGCHCVPWKRRNPVKMKHLEHVLSLSLGDHEILQTAYFNAPLLASRTFSQIDREQTGGTSLLHLC